MTAIWGAPLVQPVRDDIALGEGLVGIPIVPGGERGTGNREESSRAPIPGGEGVVRHDVVRRCEPRPEDAQAPLGQEQCDNDAEYQKEEFLATGRSSMISAHVLRAVACTTGHLAQRFNECSAGAASSKA